MDEAKILLLAGAFAAAAACAVAAIEFENDVESKKRGDQTKLAGNALHAQPHGSNFLFGGSV